MMATGASTAVASDSHALKDGEALREPELPFQEVVTCMCSRISRTNNARDNLSRRCRPALNLRTKYRCCLRVFRDVLTTLAAAPRLAVVARRKSVC